MSNTLHYLHDCGSTTACSPPLLPLLRACCEWHYLSYAATVH